MSRRIITIALTLALMALVCAAEYISVRRITEEAMQETQAILSAVRARAYGQAKERTHQLDQMWDRKAKRLEVLVDHGSTDDVRYALSRLLAALEAEDFSTALIYAGELEGGIEHVSERQALTLENIL